MYVCVCVYIYIYIYEMRGCHTHPPPPAPWYPPPMVSLLWWAGFAPLPFSRGFGWPCSQLCLLWHR